MIKKSGEWKIQVIMKTNFISSENFNKIRDCLVNLVMLKL